MGAEAVLDMAADTPPNKKLVKKLSFECDIFIIFKSYNFTIKFLKWNLIIFGHKV